MPKQTFLNLKDSKREQITDAFLREFATKTFDEASLTVVVKELGIAKGSIYQYFEDKLDLFMYLIQESTAVKMHYVGSLKREDFTDFWDYFKALYTHGFQFDKEHPLHSHFLHNLVSNLHSPSVKNLYHDMLRQTVVAFEEMAKKEIQSGAFRDDISIKTMGFMLYRIGAGVQEYLEFQGIINPKESIQNKKPVYQGKKQLLLALIEEYILLIRPAFDK